MTSPLPTGTVTFLFSDIEGSTERWDRYPDAMRVALERHDALLRQAIESHAGQVFKTVGDAFCAAFGTAGAGLSAAIDAQRAIAAEDWSRFGEGFPPILVRMGMHTEEATERGGDYFDQRVPQVRIEHPTDAQVRDSLRSFAAGSQDRLVAIVAQTRLIPARLVP